MSFPVSVIQTLSATVIFVAGYLVLFTVAIFILVLASCIYRGGRLMKAYMTRTGYQDRVVADTLPHRAGIHQ
jgi:hypothetical protein